MSSREQLAVASITGIAERYAALHRIDWHEAMQEIQNRLAGYKIPTDRIVEVLSESARHYLSGGRHFHAAALQLLLDAGANLDRTRELALERSKRRVISFGDATLGG